MHYRLWNNSTIVVWLQGQKAFNSNSPFPRSQFFFTSSAHPASIVTSAVDQIWYYIRPGYVWLFSYKVTNSTPSLNRIAPREISDIIWSTFLTSLGCGCVELWNNKVCHLTRDTRAPKKITPLQTYLAKKKKKSEILSKQIVQCLQEGEEEETGLWSSQIERTYVFGVN